VLEVPETVINMVDYKMVQQMSLASTAYDKGVNEFVKAGLTELASENIKPPRVAQSPVQMECKVIEVKALGDQGGAGNLVICEILKIHISETILDENNTIDPVKMDQVSRMGANWYSRANQGLFIVPKPIATKGIGVDQLPEAIRKSTILTGNDLGMLGNVSSVPDDEAVAAFAKANPEIGSLTPLEKHQKAQAYLLEKNVNNAWKILLSND
jgi:hypothetical protein